MNWSESEFPSDYHLVKSQWLGALEEKVNSFACLVNPFGEITEATVQQIDEMYLFQMYLIYSVFIERDLVPQMV